VIHVHTERVDDPARRAEIVAGIERVLADVRVCVADWSAMKSRIADQVRELRANPPPLPVGEIAEAIAFLEWLAENNFTILGTRENAFSDDGKTLAPVDGSGLGLLRAREMRELRRGSRPMTVTPEVRAFLEEPRLLIVTKAA